MLAAAKSTVLLPVPSLETAAPPTGGSVTRVTELARRLAAARSAVGVTMRVRRNWRDVLLPACWVGD
jgi:hypothetical protein